MKKSLLITTSLLTLGVVTGIYAQSVGATGSIVDKMKAVAHSFTLGSTLNPTDTGLTSDPVKGKKTGDILTAGEYNRLLELLSEGGGGGSSVGGAGWVDVPLTDTSSFDIDCEYRFRMSGVGGNSVIPGFSQTHWYDVTYKSAGAIANAAWVYLRPGNKQTVYLVDTSNNGVMDVTAAWGWKTVKIEKLCGGGSGGGNTGSGVAGIAAAIRASGHTLAIPSGITDWPDTIVCDGYGGWAGGNQVLTLSVAAANTVGYTQSEGIGVYFNPSTGVLTQADRVGTCGASPGNIAAICAAGRCVYGGNSPATSSNLVYINPDNTNFAPLECKPGVNYMINPIAFSADSASAYTTMKLAVLKTGNWKARGTGFVRIRNKDSNSTQTFRFNSVLDSVTDKLFENSADIGMYASSFSEDISVPASKTAEINVSVRNNTVYGGTVTLWCTN